MYKSRGVGLACSPMKHYPWFVSSRAPKAERHLPTNTPPAGPASLAASQAAPPRAPRPSLRPHLWAVARSCRCDRRSAIATWIYEV